MHDFAIETSGLKKSFGNRLALNGLDLRVPAGSIFGFLGRNGAGKTTTIKILMGMLKADSGTSRVFNMDPADPRGSIDIRSRIGFVTEDKDLYPYMNVEQMIRFTRPFFPKWRDDLERRYLKMFDLPPKRKVSDLSKGMRSKLMLLIAICHGAELLILDEPTDGLDPAAVEEVLRELVTIAGSQGATIFFSSHQLNEVEQIADHICIVDKGRAIVTGVLDDLKQQYRRFRIVLQSEALVRPDWVREIEGIESFRQEGRTVSILASRNLDAIADRIDSLSGASVERFPVGLKEIFLEHVRSDENALV
jgi:ABC-2 type transport system ATP-binding protein